MILSISISENCGLSALPSWSKSILQLLSFYYGGSQLANYFSIDGLNIPVWVQMQDTLLKDPKSIEKISITSPKTQKTYPITNFVKINIYYVKYKI